MLLCRAVSHKKDEHNKRTNYYIFTKNYSSLTLVIMESHTMWLPLTCCVRSHQCSKIILQSGLFMESELCTPPLYLPKNTFLNENIIYIIQYGPQKLVEAIHPFPIIDCRPSTLVALNNLPIDSLNFISTKNALLINECNFLLTFFGAEGSQQRQYGVG